MSGSRFAEFVQKEGGQLVFSLLQFIFGDVSVSCDGNVKSKLVSLKQVKVEEVDNLGTILPSPSTQDSWSVNRLCSHEVIKKRIEVLV